MKAVINMGKIDFCNRGRKDCPVKIEIELRIKDENKFILSICAYVWNPFCSDIYMGGQCLDELYPFFLNDPVFQKLYNWWKSYHLNDMHAGTPEQEQALAEVHLLGANKYEQACKYLKSIGLYEVPYKGETYKYGHGWIYYPIPEQTQQEIDQFVYDVLAVS